MDRRIKEIQETIEQDWDKHLTVTELAKRVNLSVRHLESLFREEMGTTIKQSLKEKRLNEAAKLLLGTHKQVSEICFAVGYHDLPSFTKAFKERFEKSPREFRKTLGEVISPSTNFLSSF